MSEKIAPTLLERSVIPNFVGVGKFDEIKDRFIVAARSIMLAHKLVYEENCWQITALELYLKLNDQPDLWRDPTAHEDPEQLKRGTWYVHDYDPDSGGRAPGYCGIDISAGCESSNIYAGLLIREIECVDGSAKALQTILRGTFRRDRWSDDEKRRLQQIHGKTIDSGPLRLVARAAPIQGALWIGPRIFKAKKKPEPEFRDCCLRAATWKTKVNNTNMKPVPNFENV